MGGNKHKPPREVIAGLSTEYAGLGRMITAGGTVTPESGRTSLLAAVNS